MGRLTTHVLDIANGCPAAGMSMTLYRVGIDAAAQLLSSVRLNACGRTDSPLLEGGRSFAGQYRLVFFVGEYFRDRGTQLPSPPFLDRVQIDVGLAEADGNYHVPLLVSPWAFSAYRGS